MCINLQFSDSRTENFPKKISEQSKNAMRMKMFVIVLCLWQIWNNLNIQQYYSDLKKLVHLMKYCSNLKQSDELRDIEELNMLNKKVRVQSNIYIVSPIIWTCSFEKKTKLHFLPQSCTSRSAQHVMYHAPGSPWSQHRAQLVSWAVMWFSDVNIITPLLTSFIRGLVSNSPLLFLELRIPPLTLHFISASGLSQSRLSPSLQTLLWLAVPVSDNLK